ncbi:ABC transporter substrate-binding protein [Oleomonas cavernae]|nr:ABC transporter substrate-binding protein [Oleomonas cavernae]
MTTTMMKKLTGLAAGLAVAAFSAQAMARDLSIVSWGGAYQDAQKKIYFEPLKAAGVALTDESWDGGIGVLRAKIEGGQTPWDVVQVESEELVLGCEEGLFEKLDFAKIGGKDAYLPAAVHDCGVGAIVYNFVLGYDKDKLKDKAPTGWADFFDTKTFPGKRGLRQGPKTTLEIALMADGVAPADVYKVLATPEGVDRAFKKLDEIKAEIVWWKAGAQPPQLLAAGEVVMTSVYNGRIDAANKEGRHFGIVWNGSLYTIDSWVIMKGSPNVDAAYKFLAFVGKPENQAKLPLAIAYGVTNPAASPLIPAERLKELPTDPANLGVSIELSTAFWIENVDRLTERFNKWAAK